MVDATPDAAPRSHVGAELRQLRERLGHRIAEISAQLTWSQSKLSRIETGQSGIRASDLTLLLDLYEVKSSDRQRLSLMAANSAKMRPWVDGYSKVLPEPYVEYLRLEADAATVWMYEATAVIGLLQTAEYATALARATSSLAEADAVATRVAAQMARQVILTREPPLKVTAVLDESALRRIVGGPGVMHRQMLRLIELSAHPAVTFRIVPFNAGAHAGMIGSFSILDFDSDRSDSSVTFCDGLTGGRLLRGVHDRQVYHSAAQQISRLSMSHEDSLQLIRDVMTSM